MIYEDGVFSTGSDKMRIAFFGLQQAFDYNHIGGSESITRRLARELTQDADVDAADYVLFHARRTETQEVMPKVRVRYFEAYADAAKALLDGYDHVVSIYLSPPERIPFMAFRARYQHRIRFHAFVTMWRRSRWKRLLLTIDLQFMPLNGAMFAISPRLYKSVKRWARRPFLILPPVPDEWFLRVVDKPVRSRLHVTFVGRIDPGKGAADAAELFYRLQDAKKYQCRFIGYTYEPGRVSRTEEALYGRLKALPPGTFVEANYSKYSPQVDAVVRKTMAETDVLLLPYRDVSSTADMPLVFMEGMASLCALIIPPSAADLPLVYGPGKFYLREDAWVESMRQNLLSVSKFLREERERIEARNAQLNFGAAASAQAFKRALLGQEPPRVGAWPENLLTFKGSLFAR
jgi:glycosyltransferase involved in cell wall biosynthesis